MPQMMPLMWLSMLMLMMMIIFMITSLTYFFWLPSLSRTHKPINYKMWMWKW